MIRWGIVLILLVMILYVFRSSAGPILAELKGTKPAVILVICGMTIVYHIIEGLVTTVLAKEYQPEFTWAMGIQNAFYCSFYRVATLGSASGVAAVYNLNEHGVAYGQAFGLYMMQYAFHKLSIAFFSLLFGVMSWKYMYLHFHEYIGLLLVGYLMTAAVSAVLVLTCCSAWFHKGLFRVLDWVNAKTKNRFELLIAQLCEQCGMMEEASRYLLRQKTMVVKIIGLDLCKLCFWYAIPYFILKGETSITLPVSMAVTSLSVMLAAVLPAPAGIGSTEFVFTKLFSEIVEAEAAAAASLLYRFGVFVFPFLLGAVVVIVRHFQKKRDRKQEALQRD